MTSIENIFPIYDNTYILTFSKLNKELVIITPATKIILRKSEGKSNKIIHNTETHNRMIYKDTTRGICSLTITDDFKKSEFYFKVNNLEAEINKVVSKDFPDVKLSDSIDSISNILISCEHIDIVEQYLSEDVNVSCTITPQGCITPHNTFEIVYKLTSIQKIEPVISVIKHIYSLLDENNMDEIEKYIHSIKEIYIHEISKDEIDKLQNEIEKQIEIIQ